jgi:uncharacterized protein YdaU (DUF1376 family)
MGTVAASELFSGPWLPWFHGDFIRATQGWTIVERGVYFLLLGASWEMGPLPNDHRRLAGIVGAQLDEFDEAWKTVRPKFTLTSRGLTNRRLEVHRSKQALRSEKARQSVMNRWQEKPAPHTDVSTNDDTNVDTSDDTSEHTNGHTKSIRSGYSSELRDQNSEKDKNTEPRVEGKPSRAARAISTRLPVDFELTEERKAFAESEHLDPGRTLAQFRDYWTAAAGAKARKVDWDATWRTWCRSEKRGNSNGAAPPRRRPKTAEQLLAEEKAAHADR